ncbi:hypothetical protein [Anaeroselena agilis]|uniref:Uncharacterized protein n=1 Tax=Anaeroselena agilis TaxID=3063788 RepID=A0ABU3NV94_9FIRM|nr:hypothetical protein [Selenomonadales bacterium 4137-cl]
MRKDQRSLESKIGDPDTAYIVIYPDPGIDITAFTDDLRGLLNSYHVHGQGWTIGSNIELDGQPLVGERLDHPGI